MPDNANRYDQYARLRHAVKEHGEPFEGFLLRFVKSSLIFTRHFAERKQEIEARVSKIVKSAYEEEPNFDSILKEIFPIWVFEDPYECDCEVLNQLEVILDVLEDHAREKEFNA